MNETEDRLRGALARAAAAVEPDEHGSLDVIRRRGVVARRRRAALVSSLGLILVGGVAVGAAHLDRDHRAPVHVGPAATGSTSTATGPGPTTSATSSTTTPSSTTSTPVPVAPATAVFPSSPKYTNEPDLVHAFIEQYLGAPDAYVMGQPAGSDEQHSSVAVYGRDPNGVVGTVARSTLSLENDGGYWYVTGASSPSVVLDPITCCAASPATVSGQGVGFEGTIVAEVRGSDGSLLGDGNAIAGSGPDLAPFTITVQFTPTGVRTGSLIVHNTSGVENGAVDFTIVEITLPA